MYTQEKELERGKIDVDLMMRNMATRVFLFVNWLVLFGSLSLFLCACLSVLFRYYYLSATQRDDGIGHHLWVPLKTNDYYIVEQQRIKYMLCTLISSYIIG